MIMIPKFSKTKFFICISILFLVLQINGAFATETTISVSETEGQITVNAIATFTSYLECDVDDLSNCENIDSGTLRVFHNGIEIGIVEGNSTAQFSTTLDSSVMPQGENTFSANATDHMEIITNATEEVLVDNTPLITIAELGVVEGVFDIAGTATFKNHVGGFEGSVRIWIDGVSQGEKEYEGTNINWSYSEITGQTLESDNFEADEHTISVNARAANNEWSDNAVGTFIIE